MALTIRDTRTIVKAEPHYPLEGNPALIPLHNLAHDKEAKARALARLSPHEEPLPCEASAGMVEYDMEDVA